MNLKKVVYLASQMSLLGSKAHPSLVREHINMMSALTPPLLNLNVQIQDIAWDDIQADWASFDAVLIGSTWDYCERRAEFLDALNTINSMVPVYNPPTLVTWNSHKSYLRDLATQGIKIVPTVWLDNPNESPDWPALFNHFNDQKLVVKQQVGAGAEGQFTLSPDEIAPELTQAMMVQPFQQSILDEGEFSFIFIDGEFSHALLKKPRAGDYRIQSEYGGMEIPVKPSESEIRATRAVLECLDEMPLYARVDVLRGDDGELLLIELELVEPYLYPHQGRALGERLAKALLRRLT